MNRTKLIWAAMALFALGTMVIQQVIIAEKTQTIRVLETMVEVGNAQSMSQHNNINQLQQQNISLQDDLNSCEESMIQLKFNR